LLKIMFLHLGVRLTSFPSLPDWFRGKTFSSPLRFALRLTAALRLYALSLSPFVLSQTPLAHDYSATPFLFTQRKDSETAEAVSLSFFCAQLINPFYKPVLVNKLY
jgi:hypothetical protein